MILFTKIKIKTIILNVYYNILHGRFLKILSTFKNDFGQKNSIKVQVNNEI